MTQRRVRPSGPRIPGNRKKRYCPLCGSNRTTKYGHDVRGKQRWICRDCKFLTAYPALTEPAASDTRGE